jgi:tetratricopeptide (TPR) repeat protein
MSGDDTPGVPPISDAPDFGAGGQTGVAPEIAGYRVLGSLGEGGMGTVWRACHQGTHREVALKVLRWGVLGSPKSRRRFEREVELASRLAHPHIARVYDSGLYEGLYYYAMELIEGAPLDEFVEKHGLGRRQALELMRSVCRAVQHAHERGVIHRDLKPSNILVTEDGQPHVLDFGLAKGSLEAEATLTISLGGDVLGTPAFMSPEQAAGKTDRADTRSDVYSLGVMLHRLLTGSPPHDLGGDRQEVLRRIAEEEPRRPRDVAKDLDKELEALLLKALAHDPDGRYASAGDLADDIGRYLAGEPLLAKTPTLGYFLRKRLRKHRGRVALAAGVLAALLTMAVWSYVHIAQARDEARQEAAKARTVTDFFNETLTPDDPEGTDGREVTVVAVLDKAAGQIEAKFSGQPLLEAEIRQCLGIRYMALKDYDAAHQQLLAAVELWQRHLGKDHPGTLAAKYGLANALRFQGESAEAEQLHREVLRDRERVLGKDSLETLRSMDDLAKALADQSKYGEAEELQKQVLKTAQRVLGKENPAALVFTKDLAGTLWGHRRHDEAEALYREVVQTRQRVLGEGHPDTISSMRDLANALWDQDKYREGLAWYVRLAETCERALGGGHPVTLGSVMALGLALTELTWNVEGGPAQPGDLELPDGVSRKDIVDSLALVDKAANDLHRQGKCREAEALHRRVLEARQRILGNDHADTLKSQEVLADDLYWQGKYRDAEALYEEVLRGRTGIFGDEHPETLAVKDKLAKARFWQGK